jgi:hypothetical protein
MHQLVSKMILRSIRGLKNRGQEKRMQEPFDENVAGSEVS